MVEIEQVLATGATADRISFGNTIKKERDIARAYQLGIRMFAVDCEAEVEKIARVAHKARRCSAACSAPAKAPSGRCRASSAATPRWRRACSSMPISLVGSMPYGLSFHVGSQQNDNRLMWDGALKAASGDLQAISPSAASTLQMVNLGGGFPTKYLKNVPNGDEPTAVAIFAALRKHFGNRIPETIIEPGRGMVGNAGVIEAEVVFISKKSDEDKLRWVYLDIGKFGGLAETMDEMIRYPIKTAFDADTKEPCVIAGPTCDSVDVLYEKVPYRPSGEPRDRGESVDRGHRRVHDDLFVRRLQRLPAA